MFRELEQVHEDLQGKRVLLTGASGGIGIEMLRRLLRRARA